MLNVIFHHPNWPAHFTGLCIQPSAQSKAAVGSRIGKGTKLAKSRANNIRSIMILGDIMLVKGRAGGSISAFESAFGVRMALEDALRR